MIAGRDTYYYKRKGQEDLAKQAEQYKKATIFDVVPK